MFLFSFSELPYCEYVFSSSLDGYDEEGASEGHDTVRANGVEGYAKDAKAISRQLPSWLSNSTPDEFLV